MTTLVLGVFSISGCDIPKLAATGQDDEIIVFADDTAWLALGSALQSTFEDTVYTPQPERWYTLRREPFADYSKYEKHKHRIVVGTLDGRGSVSEFVQNSLDPRVRSLVEEGKEFVFNKYDSQARGQLLMFLTAPSLPDLESSIKYRAQDLLYYFKSLSLRRELASIDSESGYHKEEIEKSLSERHGWSMTIQHDFWVAVDSAGSNFFWIRRANPADMERWIFVHWIDAANPELLSDEFVMKLRDSLTRTFLHTLDDEAHVEIAPYYMQIETVDFLGRFAYEMRGNWRFSDKSGGGPFVNYTFYDKDTRRIFMLDGSIFAPRVEKKKLILQVDGLLHTFKSHKKPEDARTNPPKIDKLIMMPEDVSTPAR